MPMAYLVYQCKYVQTKFWNKKHQPKHAQIVINYANISTESKGVNQCHHCNFFATLIQEKNIPHLGPLNQEVIDQLFTSMTALAANTALDYQLTFLNLLNTLKAAPDSTQSLGFPLMSRWNWHTAVFALNWADHKHRIPMPISSQKWPIETSAREKS